jgi:DNA-binding CsgD family transcriptional regulator
MALFATPDIVEVAVRCGELELASTTLERLDAWTARTKSPWSQAWTSALDGWMSRDEEWEPGFSDALRIYGSRDLPFDEARVRLLYGERLRGASRLGEAREQARFALVAFERIGASVWADRAREEVAASGGRPTAAVTKPFEALTPQEQQIVRFVSTGATNREVGAKLFLSPRTIQYHLHNIYLNLGVGSRGQLAALLEAETSYPLTVGQ